MVYSEFTRRMNDPSVKCPICKQVVSVPIRDNLERINLSYATELIQDHVRSHSVQSMFGHFENDMLNQLSSKLDSVIVG